MAIVNGDGHFIIPRTGELFRYTPRRFGVLRFVLGGHVFQKKASGCYWVDAIGMGFGRGTGKVLTDLNQAGLLTFEDEVALMRGLRSGPFSPTIQRAALSKNGRRVFDVWWKKWSKRK